MSPVAPGRAALRQARIDLDALRSNVRIIRELVAPARLLVVVKAEGYGHGAELVARAALEAGADRLGVADIPEALALRAAGIEAPILAWLHGPDADFAAALDAGIDVGVSTIEQIRELARLGAARSSPAQIQVKLDTGLSRNGVDLADWPTVAAELAELVTARALRVTGVFSHLSNTSLEDDAAQLVSFETALEVADSAGLDVGLRHIAASEAAITRPESRYDQVRVGITMYGLPPDARVDVAALGLRPVMELSASIIAVRQVPAGAGVSYGFTHRTERPTTLALIPLGYADGVPRSASGRGAEVFINGRRYPIVGRIAMDQLVVDLGDASAQIGDRAVLWGDPATGVPSAEDWARWAGTIGYEIVTRVGPRVPRVAVG